MAPSGMRPPEIVQRYVDAWRRHDLDAYVATYGPEATYSYPGAERPARREELKELLEPIWVGFPSVSWETLYLSSVADGLTVWVWLMRGTHTGDFYGTPATGRHVVWPGVEFIESDADRILRIQGFYDMANLRSQLGLAPRR